MAIEMDVKKLLETKECYEYSIYGNKIQFSKGEMKYYKIRDYFDVISENAIDYFCKEFKNCGSIENFAKRMDNIAILFYEEYIIKPAVKVLQNESLYGWDVKRLENYCFEYLDEFLDKVDKLYILPYENLIDDKKYMAELRKDRRKNRKKYVGYGYNLETKISASMKAGMINTATGLGHGVRNAVGNTATKISTDFQVLSLYSSSEKKKELVNYCKEVVNGVRLKIHTILDKEAEYKIVILTEKACLKAETTFNNICNGVVKNVEAQSVLVQVLKDYPRFGEAYFYAIDHFGDEDRTLMKMATDFKVDLRGYIDSTLDKKYGYVMKKQYDNEEELFKIKEQILSSLKWYGLSENSKYIVHLEKEWIELDRRLRSRDGIEFSTREEAVIYSEDKEVFNAFITEKNLAELDLLNEEVVRNLRLESASLEYKGDAFKLRLDDVLPVVMKPHIEKQTVIKRVRETGDIAGEVRAILTASGIYNNIQKRVIFSIDSKHKLHDVLEYIKSDEKLIFAQDFSKINKTWKRAILFTDKKVILINSKRFIGVYYDNLQAINYQDYVMMLSDNKGETMKSEVWKGISLQDFSEWKVLIENIVSALQLALNKDENVKLENFDVDRVKNRSDLFPILSVVCAIVGVLTMGLLYIPQILAIIFGAIGNKKAKHPWLTKVGIGIGIILLLYALWFDTRADVTTDTTTTESMSTENVLTGNIVKLEEYINEDMTADEMGTTLQEAGFNFVLDESGDYRTDDSSIWIYNTDLGGCNVIIEPSLEAKYSIYGLYCGMTLEEAAKVLEIYEAVQITDEHDTKYKEYQILDKYSVILTLDGEEVVGISFSYFK